MSVSPAIYRPALIPQDLHVHTTYSSGDDSIVREQTVEFLAQFRHARILGISDHTEYILDNFDEYQRTLRAHRFHVGTEVNGAHWVRAASELDVDYYFYHCRDNTADYLGAEELLDTGKPVVISHPLHMGTNLQRVPKGCYVEINNRYVWRYDWRAGFTPYLKRFRFVISSDAHQPHFLNQHVARQVARELGIGETLLFPRVAWDCLPEVG